MAFHPYGPLLKEPRFSEGEISPPPYDDVILHGYVEDSSRLNELFGRDSVIGGRRRVSARMIVNENYCRRVFRDRFPEYFARMHQ